MLGFEGYLQADAYAGCYAFHTIPTGGRRGCVRRKLRGARACIETLPLRQ